MAALEAVVRTRRPGGGERTIPLADFHVSYGEDPARETALEHGELITAVDLPAVPWFARSAYLKVRDRASFEFALASAAVALDLDRVRACRIALGGVATKPWRARKAEQALAGAAAGEAAWRTAAQVRVGADGRDLVRAATQGLGTGSYNIFTQVAADALGLPVELVTFQLGNTDFPESRGSGGSCTAASVSEPIVQAARAVHAKLTALATTTAESPLAGHRPDDLALTGGRVVLARDPRRVISFADLLRRAGLPEAAAKPDYPKTDAYSTHSFGAMFCEVKIDPLLPAVRVSRVVAVIDVGRVLNPKTSRSQVLGGFTMGLGMALMEHTVYDPRSGRPVTDNLADYLVPVNADIESIDVQLLDHPDPHINTLGCCGLGEIGITGIGAAVANAVHHATGRRIRDLPITLDKLL